MSAFPERNASRSLRQSGADLTRLTSVLDEQVDHYRRPLEKPFLAEERDRTTILFGGLTWRHDQLVGEVFQAADYRCEILPEPDLAAFRIGQEFCSVGQCNPVYFTLGSLIQFLRSLGDQGLSRREIIDNYVFFTAGSCGPCRFGMYEAEYRSALEKAGFEGFRVLVFQQQEGIRQEQAGLQYTVDLGLGLLNALNLGDVLSDLIFQIRPYEVCPGETERVARRSAEDLGRFLRERDMFEVLEAAPSFLARRLSDKKGLGRRLNNLGKIGKHFYAGEYAAALERCRRRFDEIEVDRLRVKPVVKITGEFWGQLTESAGNYNMFAFLELEGAQVMVDPLAEWVRYLLYQAKANHLNRRGLDDPFPEPRWWQLPRRLANRRYHWRRWLRLGLAERVYSRQYNRVKAALGDLAHELIPQGELARLAHPYYNSLARGGEGHLEVGKSIYYTANNLCHMVLSLKPFGCMPSTQSDGVQAAVSERYRDMIFLPVETSGDGEIRAQSRVQMALREARLKAQREFQQVLRASGRGLDEIRDYVDRHPELRRPFYPVPAQPGIACSAANFVRHACDLMDGKAHLRDA